MSLHMSRWKQAFPLGYHLFMKIAEPRVVRLLHFGIYLCLTVAGAGVLCHPPRSFSSLIGITLVYAFGGFLFVGATLGLFSVLPGIWWLERVGLIAVFTAMLIYAICVISLGASLIGIAVPIAFMLTFVLRWMEIMQFQLAPREG